MHRKISYKVTKENYMDLLEELEAKGIFWMSGQRATEYDPFTFHPEDYTRFINYEECLTCGTSPWSSCQPIIYKSKNRVQKLKEKLSKLKI